MRRLPLGRQPLSGAPRASGAPRRRAPCTPRMAAVASGASTGASTGDAAAARLPASGAKLVAFLGLGTMGYPMAGHVARLPGHRCLVWNRTVEKAQRHAQEHDSTAASELAELGSAEVLVLCLPSSAEDASVAEQLAPYLSPHACLVSCTSGQPAATKQLATSLKDRFGLHFVDCPVSGGPQGAAKGTLTCMLGADDALEEMVRPVIQSFSKKIVRCGPVGTGHAVKAVNNALNVAHLLLGAEGLLALQSMGVDPAIALEAINGSSGRSLQTEVRLPQEVLTRRFQYGFKLSLMAKDCQIAAGVLQEHCAAARLLPCAIEELRRASAEEPEDADYTAVVRHLERRAGAELRTSTKAPLGPQPAGREGGAGASESEAKAA